MTFALLLLPACGFGLGSLPARPDRDKDDTGVPDTAESDTDTDTDSDTDADTDSDTDTDTDSDADADTEVDPQDADVDADGWSLREGDCDDEDASRTPEDRDADGYSSCDDDCDDTNRALTPVDDDRDSYSTCTGDCDETDRATFPGAAETESGSACMTDTDNDGWGDATPRSTVTGGTDCDDSDANRNPGESDTPWNGRDEDCSGVDAGSTLSASGTGGAIVDMSTLTGSASLGGCAQIYDLTVSVNITHSYIGDLTLRLTNPSGTSLLLHNRTGGSTNNLNGSYAITGGSLSEAEPLSAMVGDVGTGGWTLEVADNASGDSGTLNSWSLSVACP